MKGDNTSYYHTSLIIIPNLLQTGLNNLWCSACYYEKLHVSEVYLTLLRTEESPHAPQRGHADISPQWRLYRRSSSKYDSTNRFFYSSGDLLFTAELVSFRLFAL